MRYLIVVIIFITLFSCSKEKESAFGSEGDIIISGKIIDFDKSNDPNTVQLYRRDFFNLGDTYCSEIDSNGDFNIELSILYPQELYLMYGKYIHIVCSPGDSLYVEIDHRILKEKTSIDFLKFSDNEIGKTNMLINEFHVAIYENEDFHKYMYQDFNDAVRDKSFEEFEDFIYKRTQDYSSLIDKIRLENKCPELFNKWANDYLKYMEWQDLMRYSWCHTSLNNIPDYDIKLPKYDFIFSKYNMNDNEIFTFDHTDFLHELYMFFIYSSNDSLIRTNKEKKLYNLIDGVSFRQKMIDKYLSGFTKELLQTKNYLDILRSKELELFESVFDSTYTLQQYFLDVVNEKHDEVIHYYDKYYTNDVPDGGSLSTIKSEYVSGVIDTIMTKYKNKVIYIDFWGSWCGACMDEITKVKVIQEYYKDKNVVFLFLAIKCEENSWNEIITKKEIMGEHILLTDDQFNVFDAHFKISGIPRYMLIDKNGNIVSDHALPPSNKNELIKEIDKLLSK